MIKPRNRKRYLFLTLLTIGLGLLSRKVTGILPGLVNTYLGDVLWAAMVYLIAATFFYRTPATRILTLSLLFCYLIEISQLYHAPWIDSIRTTTLGGLILGFGFLWSDLLAYTIGAGFTCVLESLYRQSRKKVRR